MIGNASRLNPQIVRTPISCEADAQMECNPDGDYVLFADYERELKQIKERLANSDKLLKDISRETRAIADGELGNDWADEYERLWNILAECDAHLKADPQRGLEGE